MQLSGALNSRHSKRTAKRIAPAARQSPIAGLADALFLGRKTLAALGPTASKNLLAAGRQHALAESMAALANKAARLIRALHGTLRPKLASASALREGRRIALFFPMLRKAAAPGQQPQQNANFSGIQASYSLAEKASQRAPEGMRHRSMTQRDRYLTKNCPVSHSRTG